jgi:phosphoribosyl 1,2-cyclic phosphodiesterase
MMSFGIRFWGVRGSIACPSPKHIGYGGNTSCIQVFAGDQRIILDAGTGIRGLGDEMLADDVGHADILLTHTHWDHINGFPFFAPAYDSTHSFNIMAGHLAEVGGVRAVLASQMTNPTFPIPLEVMQSKMEFVDFTAGNDFQLDSGITVGTTALNHPGGSTGYRIDFEGKSFCYITDTEHVPDKPDENVLGLIEGADLVIYDATYTDEEFPAKIGWGHSTWQEGLRLCRAANAKSLAIFHHDPSHDDDVMQNIEADARASWSHAFVAREGMKVNLT